MFQKQIYLIDKNCVPILCYAMVVKNNIKFVDVLCNHAYLVRGTILYTFNDKTKRWNKVGVYKKDFYFVDDLLIFRLYESGYIKVESKDGFIKANTCMNIDYDLFDYLYDKDVGKRLDLFVNAGLNIDGQLENSKYVVKEFVKKYGKKFNIIVHGYSEVTNRWRVIVATELFTGHELVNMGYNRYE